MINVPKEHMQNNYAQGYKYLVLRIFTAITCIGLGVYPLSICRLKETRPIFTDRLSNKLLPIIYVMNRTP